jgi:hypothetical protein
MQLKVTLNEHLTEQLRTFVLGDVATEPATEDEVNEAVEDYAPSMPIGLVQSLAAEALWYAIANEYGVIEDLDVSIGALLADGFLEPKRDEFGHAVVRNGHPVYVMTERAREMRAAKQQEGGAAA